MLVCIISIKLFMSLFLAVRIESLNTLIVAIKKIIDFKAPLILCKLVDIVLFNIAFFLRYLTSGKSSASVQSTCS